MTENKLMYKCTQNFEKINVQMYTKLFFLKKHTYIHKIHAYKTQKYSLGMFVAKEKIKYIQGLCVCILILFRKKSTYPNTERCQLN